jgi:Domain of unknown function (DUF5615)
VLAGAADNDLNNAILRGLASKGPLVDVVRVSALGLPANARDDVVLERCASTGRVLITSDARTMPSFAYERIEKGAPLPGVVVVPQWLAAGLAIDQLLLLLDLKPEDLRDRVIHLPLR